MTRLSRFSALPGTPGSRGLPRPGRAPQSPCVSPGFPVKGALTAAFQPPQQNEPEQPSRLAGDGPAHPDWDF